MSFESAERVVTPDGRQYHIGLGPGEVARPILLVGDPARADRIATRMSSLRVTRQHREFRTHTGMIGANEVTVMATGIGCDNTEIAVVELLAIRRDAIFLRVGTCGALQESIGLGDLVVSTGALRLESTSLGFVEPGYPAVAHHEMVLALMTAAARAKAPCHLGITATASGFYGWQGRRGNLLEPREPELLERLGRQGVLNLEMEASTLLTLASLSRNIAGAVCTVFANRPQNRFIAQEAKIPAEDRAVTIGLAALEILAAMRGPSDQPYLVPTGF